MLERLKALCHELLDPKIAAHHGRIRMSVHQASTPSPRCRDPFSNSR